MKLTDDSKMPFGKHAGTRMQDVPASYLLWLWNEGIRPGDVREYIERNLSALEKEDPNTIILNDPRKRKP